MLEKSFGLFFFLKQPKNQKRDVRYVYLRITVDGTSKELSTKRLWNADRWNQSSGRATGTKEDAKMGVSEICYTLFSGKLTTYFAGKEMQQML